MSDVSGFRNNLLRGLYEESLRNPQAMPTIADLPNRPGDGIAPELVQLVVEELKTSGLITLGRGKPVTARPLKLTANGYYEAERLGGVVKTPALARVAKLIKDHQKLSILIAVVGVVLAIAYPEYKEMRARQAAAPMIDNMKAMNKITQDGEHGMEQMAFLMEVDTFCRDNPSASEYRGMSCELSRGERPPTEEEVRDYCRRFPAMIHLGGVSCSQAQQ